jgi:hypothetical protein
MSAIPQWGIDGDGEAKMSCVISAGSLVTSTVSRVSSVARPAYAAYLILHVSVEEFNAKLVWL